MKKLRQAFRKHEAKNRANAYFLNPSNDEISANGAGPRRVFRSV